MFSRETGRDGVAEGGDDDAKRVREGQHNPKRHCSLVCCPQPHTADSCVAEPGSNRAPLPLTANPLPPGGEQTREEEQKKQVKRPYVACMRAESCVATSRSCSKTLKLEQLHGLSQLQPNKACVHLVFGRLNI